MIHEEKKTVKILEELTLFFMSVGAKDIHTGIKIKETKAVLTFDSDYNPEYENNLSALDKYLNEPRNDEMEDIYWELAGSGDPGETSQLLLVGMMVDKANIVKKDGRIYLTLIKEFTEI